LWHVFVGGVGLALGTAVVSAGSSTPLPEKTAPGTFAVESAEIEFASAPQGSTTPALAPRQRAGDTVQPGPKAPDPARANSRRATAIDVFRSTCLECHDNDGKGGVVRDLFPKVPDFTDPRWQDARKDAELGRSILEGKGKSMPRMKEKLGSVDVRQMVAFVRGFRGGKQIVDDEPDSTATPEPPTREITPPVRSRPTVDSEGSQATTRKVAAGGRLFRRYCAMCHSSDGRATQARNTLAAIPDFTHLGWHKSRSDAQLTVSVLDGKGTGMPPFRSKLTREQARELVRFVRTFAPDFKPVKVAGSDVFDAEFGKLSREFEELQRQLRALSSGPQGKSVPRPADPPPPEIRR
jgi:mono/diheme cytochrome c family protein